MIDLELTKRCAEAMGYVVEDEIGSLVRVSYDYRSFVFRPLHDDAQCMALVKKFCLELTYNERGEYWICSNRGSTDYVSGQGPDLNRAIVECVAKLESSKHA